ncbi:glucosyltransferase domain-containing protein, partial [Enterobacter hormaechei]
MITIRKEISFAFGLFLAYSLPLIIWGGYYIDDYVRVMSGGTGWSNNGRPLADLFFFILNFGGVNATVYPLPQLLAIGVMAITSVLLWRKFIPETGRVGILAVSPMMLSPLFLENLSFTYDSVTMALSVLFAILPIIASKHKLLLTFIAITISLCLYQAALSVFIVFVALIHIINIEKDRSGRYKELFNYVLGMLVSTAIYYVLIAPAFINGPYSQKKSQLLKISDPLFFDTLAYNINRYFDLIITSFNGWLFISIFLACATSALYIIKTIANTLQRNGKIKIVDAVFILLALFAAFLSTIFPISLLQSPLFSPRVLFGVNAVLASTFIISALMLSKATPKLLYSFLVPTFSFFMISYSYANAIKNQNIYESSVIDSMIADAFSFNNSKNGEIAINGRIALSPLNKILVQKEIVINRMIPKMMVDNSYWGGRLLLAKGFTKRIVSETKTAYIKEHICSFKKVKTSNYYDVFTYGSTVVFDFNKGC